MCLLIDGRNLALAAGMAAMVGHVAPIARKFNGGKGVATLAGLSWVLYPFVALGLFILWIPLMKLFKRASLGSIIMVLLFPVGVLVMPETRWYEVIVAAAASAVVTIRHHEKYQTPLQRRGKRLLNKNTIEEFFIFAGAATLPFAGEWSAKCQHTTTDAKLAERLLKFFSHSVTNL